MVNDEELVQQVRRGETGAFDELYRRYSRRLYLPGAQHPAPPAGIDHEIGAHAVFAGCIDMHGPAAVCAERSPQGRSVLPEAAVHAWTIGTRMNSYLPRFMCNFSRIRNPIVD